MCIEVLDAATFGILSIFQEENCLSTLHNLYYFHRFFNIYNEFDLTRDLIDVFFSFEDLDRIIEPLRTTVQAKVKAYSVKQEFEKQDELKRSALRAVAALQQIPDAGNFCMVFQYIDLFFISAALSKTYFMALLIAIDGLPDAEAVTHLNHHNFVTSFQSALRNQCCQFEGMPYV